MSRQVLVCGASVARVRGPATTSTPISSVRLAMSTPRAPRKALRNASARVIRGKEVLFDGAIRSLRHFKNDVRELAMGMEGGVVLDGFDDYEEGDVLEIHHQEKVAR